MTVLTERVFLGHEFWDKVERTPTCWRWEGAHNNKGYPVWSVRSKPVLAHRAAWMWLVGPIPDDLTIDHLCREHNCVNVAHMELVTRAENSRRESDPPEFNPYVAPILEQVADTWVLAIHAAAYWDALDWPKHAAIERAAAALKAS
jgi:hypothetical protein